jgi:hypothetical protein
LNRIENAAELPSNTIDGVLDGDTDFPSSDDGEVEGDDADQFKSAAESALFQSFYGYECIFYDLKCYVLCIDIF